MNAMIDDGIHLHSHSTSICSAMEAIIIIFLIEAMVP